MLYWRNLDETDIQQLEFECDNNINEGQKVDQTLPESYQEEIKLYREIFDESIISENDYTTDDAGVLLPGKNKINWRTIKFDIPVKNNDKISIINFKLYVYLKAPLFSIFATNKDSLYANDDIVVNIWPFMHNKKFIRDNVKLITKMSPTVDIMDYPIRFHHNEKWRHIHSEKYFFSKKNFEVRNQQISNYFGDYFTWGIHQNLQEPVKLMLMTYEFVSPILRRKFVRTCALSIFNAKLTKWINSVE